MRRKSLSESNTEPTPIVGRSVGLAGDFSAVISVFLGRGRSGGVDVDRIGAAGVLNFGVGWGVKEIMAAGLVADGRACVWVDPGIFTLFVQAVTIRVYATSIKI